MNEAGVLQQLVSQFGTAGLIIGYLIWDRMTTGKERREIDKQQLDSNIRLAEALAALKTVIEQGRR
ncbi:MAG: hypothetical protein WC803_08720 [Sphingomonas sp.]|jgi:hypothetical protein